MSASEIASYIASKDDFALEMRCLQSARGFGFEVQHGGTYLDPATAKWRQFDLRLSKATGQRRVWLAVECKSLRSSYPLVVSCASRTRAESVHSILVHPNGSPAVREHKHSQLFPAEQPLGKSAMQVGRKGDGGYNAAEQDTYAKWSQAIESASGLIASAWTERTHAHLVLPLLVVSKDALWRIDYDANGVAAEPQACDEVTLYLGRSVVHAPIHPATREPLPYPITYPIGHLLICTEVGYGALLATVSDRDSLWWDRAFEA